MSYAVKRQGEVKSFQFLLEGSCAFIQFLCAVSHSVGTHTDALQPRHNESARLEVRRPTTVPPRHPTVIGIVLRTYVGIWRLSSITVDAL